jgi:hypothetical protein
MISLPAFLGTFLIAMTFYFCYGGRLGRLSFTQIFGEQNQPTVSDGDYCLRYTEK